MFAARITLPHFGKSPAWPTAARAASGHAAAAPPSSVMKALADRAHSYFGGNTAIASTSNKAPGRASCGTPIVVLAGGAAVFT
jgi:hypothetical protein